MEDPSIGTHKQSFTWLFSEFSLKSMLHRDGHDKYVIVMFKGASTRNENDVR